MDSCDTHLQTLTHAGLHPLGERGASGSYSLSLALNAAMKDVLWPGVQAWNRVHEERGPSET